MRQDNIAILQDTLRILAQGQYTAGGKRVSLKLSPAEMKAISVYLPEDVARLSAAADFSRVAVPGGRTRVSCVNADSFTHARRLAGAAGNGRPVLVLNLANPVHPGGGVHKGSKAQEEDLCRKSSLLLSLESETAGVYYRYNGSLNTFMGSDAIMITPRVEIIRDEKNELLPATAIVSVMTCAAPMLTFGMEGLTEQQYRNMVYGRIMGMLKTAACLGYRTLVLGAFGCGAFGNDAAVVSDLFYRAMLDLTLDGMKLDAFFDRIDFAVLDHSLQQYNFREFSRNFNSFHREEDASDDPAGRACPPFTFFWKDNEINGEFSNWYSRPFVIGDLEYRHVEQYMMSEKAKLFHDAVTNTRILRADMPGECKALGRSVSPFDPAKWDAEKYRIVKEGNRAKYLQNPDLMAMLLGTGDSILAEASPKDDVWGIALDAASAAALDPKDWPGENLLGKALMELREEFRGEAAPERE